MKRQICCVCISSYSPVRRPWTWWQIRGRSWARWCRSPSTARRPLPPAPSPAVRTTDWRPGTRSRAPGTGPAAALLTRGFRLWGGRTSRQPQKFCRWFVKRCWLQPLVLLHNGCLTFSASNTRTESGAFCFRPPPLQQPTMCFRAFPFCDSVWVAGLWENTSFYAGIKDIRWSVCWVTASGLWHCVDSGHNTSPWTLPLSQHHEEQSFHSLLSPNLAQNSFVQESLIFWPLLLCFYSFTAFVLSLKNVFLCWQKALINTMYRYR